MRRNRQFIGSIAVAVALLAACDGAAPGEETEAVNPTSETADIDPTPQEPTPEEEETVPEPEAPAQEDPTAVPDIDDPPMTRQVEFALGDLSGRLGIDSEEIEVVSVEEVDWPDGSIGCPQPDMAYTQAIVNGTKVVLRVDGIQYPYHAAAGTDPFYCSPGQSVTKDN